MRSHSMSGVCRWSSGKPDGYFLEQPGNTERCLQLVGWWSPAVFGVVLQAETAIERCPGAWAQMDRGIEGTPQAGLGPAGVDRKGFAAQVEPGTGGVMAVVVHQVDGFVIGAGAIELGGPQGITITHPAMHRGLLRIDIG